jgi:8-amino-7-oxononanoate synthase
MMQTPYSEILQTLEAEGRLRTIPADFGNILDFSSNDYMGLSTCRQQFIPAYVKRLPELAMSASASRLLATNQTEFKALENRLEMLYGKPALLFNSGYHANVGCISAIAIPRTLIVADKLSHASMIDGIKLSGADFRRFRHNDVDDLRRILKQHGGSYSRVWIITEAVFSMDGDEAPLVDLLSLKNEFDNIMFYVDEAHSFGTRGPKGLGIAAEKGLLNKVDILIGTFGKAAASAGAFAIASPIMKSYLINSARSFIFSTALPPATIAWTSMMIDALAGMDKQRIHLQHISRRLSDGIEAVTGRPTGSNSQIIPLHVGDANETVQLSLKLRKAGILALPIRRPTVPAGTERIRFSLSAVHTDDNIDLLLNTLSKL